MLNIIIYSDNVIIAGQRGSSCLAEYSTNVFLHISRQRFIVSHGGEGKVPGYFNKQDDCSYFQSSMTYFRGCWDYRVFFPYLIELAEEEIRFF